MAPRAAGPVGRARLNAREDSAGAVAKDAAIDPQTDSMLPLVPWWEKTFAILALMLATWAIVPLLRLDARQTDLVDYSTEGDPVAQAIWTVVYGVVLVLILDRRWRVLRTIFKDRALWVLHILIVGSLLWTQNPDASVKRTAALFGTSLLGVYFATRYTRSDLVKLLAWTLGLAVILSVGLLVVRPDLATDPTSIELGLRGIYPQKNTFGRVLALAIIVFVLYATDQPKQRVVALVGAALAVGLLVLSSSKTGLVVFGTLALLLAVLVVARLRGNSALALLSFGVLALGGLAVGVFGDLADLPLLLGRTDTLTGRTELWGLVWDQIQAQPWFGYGYGGFWLGWTGPSWAIWAATTWQPPNAHNGFLDVWLDVGLAGLILLIISLAGSVRLGLGLVLRDRRVDALFPLLFLSYFVLCNVTETIALTYNSITWLLFVTTAIQLRGVHLSQAKLSISAWGGKPQTSTPRPVPAASAIQE